MIRTNACLLALLSASLVSTASADVILDQADRGAFNATNTATGDWKISGGSYQVRAVNGALLGGSGSVELTRNYHAFDLSGLSGVVTGATLRVYTASNAWNSTAASESVGLFEVTTSPAELLAGNAASDPAAAYADLGDGTGYGSLDFTPADVSNAVDAVLNADALAALNAAVGSGVWVVGGALTTIDASLDGNWERVLRGSGTDSPATELILTGSVVPEPTGIALLGLASLALAATRRGILRT